ncbi:glycoside hydrolase family 93 protein [Glonium stellatum]|uniref:Glycoside hydrolase family 93 protein n=1 Tax=Glonium stellatum TaxID=574774 RepID=A0A8E2JRA1_9PEZI|nr:glycoside hydrolase family 93 protein [Glonium stellatum]
MGAGTYPRATVLTDGSLLGVYTAFSSGNNIITTIKSIDSGATWTALGTVAQGPTATKDIDNPFVHQLPSGRVLCTFRNHDRLNGAYMFYRITVCYSDDKGASWTYLSTPASDSNPVNGDWEPFLIDALDGSLQLYYSRENAANDQDSLLRRSTDGGLTWSSAQTISGSGITARDGMLGLARIAIGSSTLIAIFESLDPNTGLFTVHSVKSTDDGATWGSRNLVYSPGTGKNAGAPGIALIGNKLIASFGTDEDGGTWSTGSMRVVISSDGGSTWGTKTTIHGVPSLWAGVLDLTESTFLAMYESGGTSYAQKVSF